MKPLSDAEFIKRYQALRGTMSQQQAAEAFGCRHKRSVWLRRKRLIDSGRATEKELPQWSDVDVLNPPSPEIDAEELINRRISDYKRKAAYERGRALIKCQVSDNLPTGILHFGDPHVDDDGTDWEQLKRDMALTHQDGIFGANLGDTTNNWVGRLARLYADQATTESQAWILAEHFLRGTRWLYMIGGNHDAWSGSGDPIKWIARQEGALYESSEVRIGLQFPNGESFRINARHDFKGDSQWNPAHSVMKAAQLGVRDDVLVCGHKHKSGYSMLKAPGEERVIHCIQVASYKIYDRYAREKGFRDQHISPSVLIIFDPTTNHPLRRVRVYHDVEEGAEILAWLRKRAACNSSKTAKR